MAIPLGTRLGRYEILSLLGTGGMGEVYLAQDTALGRSVALKILSASSDLDQTTMSRLLREAKVTATLNHRNINAIYEVGTQQGIHFVATEFVKGETLRQLLLRRGALPLTEAVDIALQVASALSFSHLHGIIHRDIKPDNIMLGPGGNVKVLDFGLAKVTDRGAHEVDQEWASDDIHRTDPGSVVGTLAYMSPDQAKAEPPDARSDLWSLGVVLYELITGRRPFTGTTSTALLYQILHEDPPPLALYARAVPVELQRIVTKALTKDPSRRYQSAEDFLADLKRVRKSLGLTSAGTYEEIGQWPGLISSGRSGLSPTHANLKTKPAFKTRIVAGSLLLLAGLIAGVMYLRPGPPKPNRYAVLRSQIDEAAMTAQNVMRERFSVIKPVVVELPKGNHTTGYDADAVINALATGEGALTQSLDASELEGLRDYVNIMYPVPGVEALEKLTSLDGRTIISERSKDSAFTNASQFIAKIHGLSEQGRLSIDLRVNSQPDQATYAMWPSSGSPRTTTTNNTVDNVWRGMYSYRLTKAGFKSIEDSINLVDGDGRTLDCLFHRTDERDGPHPCKLR
jgi:serine/threonine protein kinase